jgi:DNA topoisomerase-2
VNAADNRYKDPSMSLIEVNLGISNGQFQVSIRNDGRGIPIVRHKDEPDLYIPGLIFGHLLTGSNFDDDKVSLFT